MSKLSDLKKKARQTFKKVQHVLTNSGEKASHALDDLVEEPSRLDLAERAMEDKYRKITSMLDFASDDVKDGAKKLYKNARTALSGKKDDLSAFDKLCNSLSENKILQAVGNLFKTIVDYVTKSVQGVQQDKKLFRENIKMAQRNFQQALAIHTRGATRKTTTKEKGHQL